MERKYRMIRIKAGDYILPSNDGKTLWRIAQYEEDGSAQISADGKNWKPLRGKFWMTWKYDRPFFNNGEFQDPDFLDWGDHWIPWESNLETRDEAIQFVLGASEEVAAQRER